MFWLAAGVLRLLEAEVLASPRSFAFASVADLQNNYTIDEMRWRLFCRMLGVVMNMSYHV